MRDTNPIIHFSSLVQVFEKSIQITARVVRIAPGIRGIRNNIFNPIAAPRISARAVEIAARTALIKNILLTHFPKNFVDASERQSPVTIPRWAALCWRRISENNKEDR